MKDYQPTGGKLLLAADIGGTNSRLVLYESLGTEMEDDKVIHINEYKNENFPTFDFVLGTFLGEIWEGQHPTIFAGCFAVAGPVQNDKVNFNNLQSWIIDAKVIETTMNFERVILINNFAANGYGIHTLTEHDYTIIQDKPVVPGAPIVIIGSGTGLGECFVIPNKYGPEDDNYFVFATEGGHVDFAPRNDLEIRIMKWLRNKLRDMPTQPGDIDVHSVVSEPPKQVYYTPEPRVSAERIVSAKGLVNIYEFLCDEFPDRINAQYHQEIMTADDKAKEISFSADHYPLAADALDIMLSAYGSQVGDAALKYLPAGGIYIAGGIAPKNLRRITDTDSLFRKALLDKGRLKGLIEDLPIFVFVKEDLGLRGAHILAFREVFKYVQQENDRLVAERRLLEHEEKKRFEDSLMKIEVQPGVSDLLHQVNAHMSQSFQDYTVFWALAASLVTSGLFALSIVKQFTKLKR
mmetsp:Transcript_5117/g.9324  ORF Transcript_5117/g.9324 Transcript_5117/m.9324 type:complete len:464 (+) Transcript_5117:109-1500(+)|eukprot:CAMPEP_0184694196 /NCGR_PEP_ID=MMETSP0313-20130426/2235_1 /TAXON_ID=2792 /ORGANISM="Porphyridium aerugineum, Strain SAG 1380-2" /LENGTH=463 /DNA_ID=CAMNT_0027152447 /DNA_START=8 /DNA_END=1399 /DNA_ORIENTATION=+